MKTLSISALTHTADLERGVREFLNALEVLGARWIPERFGTFEPLRDMYDSSRAGELGRLAGVARKQVLLARRKKIRFDLSFWPGLHGNATSMDMVFHPNDVKTEDVLAVSKAAVAALEPDFAFAHFMTDAEIQQLSGDPGAKVIYPAGMLVERDGDCRPPMTYWGMYVGAAARPAQLQEAVEIEGLQSEPWNAGLWIQMSVDIKDCAAHFQSIWERRQAFQAAVGPAVIRDDLPL